MAALIDAIDVKRKMFFEFENTPFVCLEAEVSTPTARGGQTLVRLKMRNLSPARSLTRHSRPVTDSRSRTSRRSRHPIFIGTEVISTSWTRRVSRPSPFPAR